jgi:hypothetical protein
MCKIAGFGAAAGGRRGGGIAVPAGGLTFGWRELFVGMGGCPIALGGLLLRPTRLRVDA